MTDIAEFLLARIAEDEAAARECAKVYPAPWECSDRGWVAYVKADEPNFREVARLEQDQAAGVELGWLGDALGHIARHDPSRVLAECEAKRAIVDDADGWASSDCNYGRCSHRVDDYDGGETHWRGKYGYRALAALALPYADHPDYDPSWRP